MLANIDLMAPDIGRHTRDLWHPLHPALAKEFAFGRELLRLVKGPPKYVSKLVSRLFSVLANEDTTVLAKLSYDSVVLPEESRASIIILEAIDGDLVGMYQLVHPLSCDIGYRKVGVQTFVVKP